MFSYKEIYCRGEIVVIDCLTGKIIHIETDAITIDVRDVGYLVYCPNPYRFQEFMNETITIYTYQHVRDDSIRLFGFLNREEKRLFEKLLTVSGIGPKGALAILAYGEPKNVALAIEEEDEKFLIKFPGVGKKTARQIILDLKGKILDIFPDQTIVLDEKKSGEELVSSVSNGLKELNEALEALKALGYSDREISKVIPKLKEEELTTDKYIKKALQLILQG